MTVSGPETQRYVLVGTCRRGQLDQWPGYYNYPISEKDEIDLACCSRIDELWLFLGKTERYVLAAEFIGIKTREELIDEYKYPVKKGKPHSERYLLFKIEPWLAMPSETGKKVIVRTRDFVARSPLIAKKLKTYLELPERNDPFLSKYLPELLKALSPACSYVCDVALQLDFLKKMDVCIADFYVNRARQLLTTAKRNGKLTCVEICAGAGGQAIGLERAGFEHVALVEYEHEYCDVLRKNKPYWNVICEDVHRFDGRPYQGVDLLAGGVPCPPFSVASKQLGENDERDLFPEALRLI